MVEGLGRGDDSGLVGDDVEADHEFGQGLGDMRWLEERVLDVPRLERADSVDARLKDGSELLKRHQP
jgi:hypothetical protein